MNLKIGQCEIILHYPFFAGLTAALLLDRTGYIGLGLLAAVIHETGHLLMMAYFHSLPQKICFSAFQVNIVDGGRTRHSYQKDCLILLAGPGLNLVTALLLVPFITAESSFLLYFFYANLLLCGFNLLPIEALDGGQILTMLLLTRLNARTCSIIVDILSCIVILPLGIAGFLVLLRSKYNFSLLFISCYLMGLLLLRRCQMV